MRVQIPIPADLRDEIIAIKLTVGKKVSRATAAAEKIATELGALEKREPELAVTAEKLKVGAAPSAEAASELLAVERQLIANHERQEALRAEAATRNNITLDIASETVRKIV